MAGVGAVPAVLRTAAAALVLFGVAGYAPAKLLLPAAWREHLAVWVLPVGAACSALALAALGLLHVPMPVALGLVLAAGAIGAVLVRRGDAPAPAEHRAARPLEVVLPLAIAVLIGAIALLPVFRSGFASVHGQNGDAILAVGVAELLTQAPPTAVREGLPVDSMPIVWRSKVPIYSALAAVSSLAGQDPIVAFSTVAATIFALFSLGIFLLVRHGFGLGALPAAAAALLVPLDRIAVYVAIHPYYNQTWGMFALPFVLLAGWRALVAPSRGAFALLGIFLALALFAYPLLLPFPAVFLAAAAWRAPRDWVAELRRIPGPRARPLPWLAAAVVSVPVVAVLVRGVAEKALSAAAVLAPWTDLGGWAGPDLPYLPVSWFFGMQTPAVLAVPLVAGVVAAAVVGLRRMEEAELRTGLAAMLVMGALVGAYFYARGQGQLFYFKALAFTGPLVVALAVSGLAAAALRSGRTRVLAGAALAALVLIVGNGARQEIDETYDHASRAVLELRDWDADLPPGASVRIDVPPSGYHMWGWYMFASRPVSALVPMSGFFPHPPQGLKADYVLSWADLPRPPGAVGAPIRRNAQFTLHRLDPRIPGPDVSTRRLIYEQNRITY